MTDTITEIIKAEDKLAKINAEIKKAEAKLAKVQAKSPMPRMRDLQGETQQRILNDWATTTHVMVMSCNSYLAHIPDIVSRQQFDADAWQRLSEVEQNIARVIEVHRDMKNTRYGDMVTGSLVIDS